MLGKSMNKIDHSDDDDFYNQGFEHEGIVSIWIGLSDEKTDMELDILQDLCGIGYYQLSNQEINHLNFELVSIGLLIKDLSYSSSFKNNVIHQAYLKGIDHCKWVIAQYDFKYDPLKVKRPIKNDPIFIGYFPYISIE